MLTKMQIAAELEAMELGKRRQIANILDGLAQLAQEELEAGEDFSVPGIARINWAYTKPQAKGARFKAGDTYVGFGGAEITAEADSPERKAKVVLKAQPAPAIKKIAPKSSDKAAQRNFLSKKTGKYIAERKG